MFKYIRNKIIFVFTLAIICTVGFKVINTDARDNAYLACFIDDESCMYKFQVIYSGQEVELSRVGWLMDSSSLTTSNDTKKRVGLYNFSTTNNYTSNTQTGTGDISHSVGGNFYSTSLKIGKKTGDITITIKDEDGNTLDPASFSYGVEDGEFEDDYPKPLTFPSDSSIDATSSDINRAYDVMDLICEDFKEALIFINGGETYTSVYTLVQTAYYLVSADTGTTITGANGGKYTITYHYQAESNTNGYLYTVDIKENSSNTTQTFTYKCKKGYCNSKSTELMEDGTKNNLSITDNADSDTEFITWEHLYLEAGILYDEGITWANQADIYTVDALESSIVSMTRNLFGQIRGLLQLYEIEDCIFMNGTRGSSAFVFGAYYTSWNNSTGMLFLVMLAITLSLVAITIIKIVMKTQYSTISSVARASIFDDTKNLIVAIMGMVFIWVIVKLLLLVNYQFCQIFSSMIGSKTLSDSGGGYSTLGAIIYQIVYFAISIYVNCIYILRQFFIPVLIIISPLCLLAYAYGPTGRKITTEWFRQLIGTIFMQSVHAFVYGFILINSVSLRGIESIICCASIIPLTSIVSSIFGLGGEELIKSAKSHTNTARATATGAVSGATALASGVVTGIGNAQQKVGNAIGGGSGGSGGGSSMLGSAVSAGGSLTKAVGSGIKAAGGLANAGLNLGWDLAMQDGGGSGAITSGLTQTGQGLGDAAGNVMDAGATMAAGSINTAKKAATVATGGMTGAVSSAVGANAGGAVGTAAGSAAGSMGGTAAGSTGGSGDPTVSIGGRAAGTGGVNYTTGEYSAGYTGTIPNERTHNVTSHKITPLGAGNNTVSNGKYAYSGESITKALNNVPDTTPAKKVSSPPIFDSFSHQNLGSSAALSSTFGSNASSIVNSAHGNTVDIKIPMGNELKNEQDLNAKSLYKGLVNINSLDKNSQEYSSAISSLRKDYGISGYSISTKQHIDNDTGDVTKVPYVKLNFDDKSV